jgi:hypothetical protein
VSPLLAGSVGVLPNIAGEKLVLVHQEVICERRSPSLSRNLPYDGLSAGELEALATEGQLNLQGGLDMNMDWVMKFFMGGWLPQGKRTQMVASATAMGAVLMAFVQWGSGEMNLTQLVTLLSEKWEVFVLAFGAYFAAEKVDALKVEVKDAKKGL